MTEGQYTFAGGVLVFVAAMVPVIRSIWRIITRRRAQQLVFLVILACLPPVFLSIGLYGYLPDQNPVGLAFCYLLAMIFGAIFYGTNAAPIKRIDLALFVLATAATAVLASGALTRYDSW